MDVSVVGPLCAFGSSVTWAIASAQYSRLAWHYSVFTINFSRAMIALPLFIAAAFTLNGGISEGLATYQAIHWSNIGWFFLGMLSSYGVGDSFFFLSSRSLGVPSALAIASCYPLWTVLAGHFFGHHQINLDQLTGLFITLSGLVIVVLNIPQKQESSSRKPTASWGGIALALVSSFAWASNSYSIAMGSVGLSPWAGNTIRMTISLLICGLGGRFFAPSSPVYVPTQTLKSLWWLFAIEAFGGSACYFYGLSHSTLAIGSTLSSLSPVLVVPIAWVLRIEKFSFLRTTGVSLVVLGIWWLLTHSPAPH